MNLRIIIMVFFPIFAVAQAPQKINFQSVLRNTTGEVVSNSSVSLRISILSGTVTGTIVYSETHAKTTDAGGLMSLQIGGGTVSSGVFGDINWGGASHFIKLEADFSGGSNYVVLGTQELMSVPYALYASKTDTSVLNLASRFLPLNNKLNIVDTSNMLLAYRTGLNNKVNIVDTSNMLLAYKTGLNNKLNKTDTASLSNRIDAKLNKTDTASLSERINTKLNSSVIDLGNQTGNIIYWDNNLGKFRILAPGTEGQVLKIVSGIPVWGTDATTSVPAFSPCGATISDIDGNSYNTVLIGAQCWTKENLRVRRYNNGTSMLFDTTGGSGGSSPTWQNLTIGAHTIYANDSTATPSNRTKYGYLYNWYAAKGIYTTGNIASTDTLNICPSGWHVPTDADWTTLTTELGGESVAGGKMKSVGTSFWNSPNTEATNSSGFSVLPGGYRNSDGSFINIRDFAFVWSATEYDGNFAWYRRLNYSVVYVYRTTSDKSVGASVRCLKN